MATKNNDASREMVTQLREEVKRRGKAVVEMLMAKEREMYLEENPEDKGNGACERALLTPLGLMEDLRVPRTRSSGFYLALLPGRRRASVDTGDLILLMS